MEDLAAYTFTDRDFFEPLSRHPIGPEYVSVLRELLPADWTLNHFEIWVSARCGPGAMPLQGFKIHVSSLPENAVETLRRVVDACVRMETTFKVAGDPLLHRFLNSKRCGRGSGGKFMTIYPRDENAFRELIHSIYQRLGDLQGPYILSDQRYLDSKVVYYRYGGFKTIQQVQMDGTLSSVVVAPDGSYVPDERLPYFRLPDWVQAPYADVAAEDEDSSDLLNGRYEVQEALSFANTGGVYRALDTETGKLVVIKEARPSTSAWTGYDFSVDSTAVLRREFEVLLRLKNLSCVPQPIELFEEWEHCFIVVDYFEGTSLGRYRARDSVLVISYMHEPDRVASFSQTFRTIAERLLDAVEAVHSRGIIISDLSPNNVLINAETLELALIDFESACLPEGDDVTNPLASKWFTPGFRSAAKRAGGTLEPADDYYALGMVLYNLLFPIQANFQFAPEGCERFLEAFEQGGLPVEITGIIRALVDGRADDARNIIQSWDPTT